MTPCIITLHFVIQQSAKLFLSSTFTNVSKSQLMRKYLSFIILFFSITPLVSLAQDQNLKLFTVQGKVNVDTGTIIMEAGERSKELYPKDFTTTSAKIKNGYFTFTGSVKYPIWVSFKIGEIYNSENTAIVNGIQKISIDTAKKFQKPTNDNYVMKDVEKYNNDFALFERKLSKYRVEYDSLTKIYGRKFPDDLMLKSMKNLKSTYIANDSSLLKFIKDHPNSYYALFKLYHLLTFGSNKTLGEAYENLSTTLKDTPHGKETHKIILESEPTAIGAKIPNFRVKNKNGIKLKADFFKDHKYTLVDMWYSHCLPCIASFADYKSIRNANHKKGFEIIGISTDKTKFVDDWKEVIATNELPWPQYLDLNGVEAHKYNIHLFPTTFLLNQAGEIVETNLSPIELKDFLARNL